MGSTAIHTHRYRRFSAMLRAWRRAARLSQRDLATKLDKPASYVHKCEVAERKVDPLELLDWWRACDIAPTDGLEQIITAQKRN